MYNSCLNSSYISFNYTGTGVDIYILADGIEHDNEELHGRAFDVEFIPPHYSQWRCNKFGTHIGSLAAGVYAGVAKSSMIYVPRYVRSYIAPYNSYIRI